MEAAMKALREDLKHPFHDAPRRSATLALAAADAVMFSDQAVERIAQALYSEWYGAFPESERPKWSNLSEDLKDEWRVSARAVIAALKGNEG